MKKHLILLSIFLLAAVAAFPQGRGGSGGSSDGAGDVLIVPIVSPCPQTVLR